MPAPSISTCLWFDDQAEEAARLYVSLFDDSEITEIFYKNGDPAAGAFTVAFSLMGQRYWGLNGGSYYTLSPAASISVYVDTQAEVDRLWEALLEGGQASRCGWLTSSRASTTFHAFVHRGKCSKFFCISKRVTGFIVADTRVRLFYHRLCGFFFVGGMSHAKA